MSKENQVTKGKHASSDQPLDVSDVVRRLDSLWMHPSIGHSVGKPHNGVGTTVGRYVLERVIGQGAFGIVYKARDPELNRSVALKIPRPDVLLDSDRLARFEGEVKTCARLDHPGIVPLFEADLSRAVPYMASAFCPGPNLQQWMDDCNEPCDIESVVLLIEKIARAVQYAHDNGVVHRDLKPGNILLVPHDLESPLSASLNEFQPRLTDFGLAQITHGLHESQSSLIIGTPLYMSPEQAESRSEAVGPCSDVFGLGAILYHLLTGVAPFAAPNYAAVLLRLRDEAAIPVSSLRPDVDADLETVCMKCLHRDPADRYASAGELADDLLRVFHRQPVLGRRIPWIQRVRRWSMQSMRIHECSLMIILLAVIRLMFGPVGLLMVMATPGVSITGVEVLGAMTAHFLLTGPIDIGLIWAALRIQKRKSSRGFYWLSLVTIVTLCAITLSIATGIIPPMQWYRRSNGARILTFSFISLTYFFQGLAWYFADWERLKRHRYSAARSRLKRFLVLSPVLIATAIPGFRYWAGPSELPLFQGPAESTQLDGVDDFLTVENVGFDANRPVTLEAWIRPDKPQRGVVVSHGPIALTVVAAGDGNRFRVHVSMDENQLYLFDAKESFVSNRWTHVAMTYENHELRMFVNGRRQEYLVSRYDTETDLMTPNAVLPTPFEIVDLWPGSRMVIGNIRSSDQGAKFTFSGQIGEVRLNRNIYYFEEFQPELNLTASPQTAILFHLKDGVESIPDTTKRYVAAFHR